METFHLTPLRPLATGLPQRVWVATYAPCASEGVEQDYHRPELCYGEEFAKVQIAPTIEIVDGYIFEVEFDRLRKWIRQNHDPLLSHWRGEIDSVELARNITPVP